MHYHDENIALFVDGPNLYGAARALQMHIDYGKILEFFSTKGRLQRAVYFTVATQSDDHQATRTLVDYLAYNGWNVITKVVSVMTLVIELFLGYSMQLITAYHKNGSEFLLLVSVPI